MRRTLKQTRSWNIHPGAILREEFLVPMRLTAYQLAKALRVPAPRVNDIVLEKRGITADTAIRMARYFATTADFWMNLQASYEVRRAKVRLARVIPHIEPRQKRSAAWQ